MKTTTDNNIRGKPMLTLKWLGANAAKIFARFGAGQPVSFRAGLRSATEAALDKKALKCDRERARRARQVNSQVKRLVRAEARQGSLKVAICSFRAQAGAYPDWVKDVRAYCTSIGLGSHVTRDHVITLRDFPLTDCKLYSCRLWATWN